MTFLLCQVLDTNCKKQSAMVDFFKDKRLKGEKSAKELISFVDISCVGRALGIVPYNNMVGRTFIPA